jgi:hypothetical protein
MIKVEHEPRQLLVAAALLIITTVIQTFGVVLLEDLVLFARKRVVVKTTRARMLTLLSGVVLNLFTLYLVQMSVWAAVYVRVTGYPSFIVGLYESGLAFTTLDVPELPPDWRFLGIAEGIAALLTFAWSTGVMLTQTSWIAQARRRYVRGITSSSPSARSR